LDDILERLPDAFPIKDLMSKVEEKTPYIIVAIQECERMNNLTVEIRRSLKELNLGLKVKKIRYFEGIYRTNAPKYFDFQKFDSNLHV